MMFMRALGRSADGADVGNGLTLDGYQLSKGGRMRALMAGDVRFGGLFDLCSISQIDERENVLARFAVVHRERLMVR